MSKRHWKQHWDPNAELVFCRHIRVGETAEKPVALPGDPLSKTLRKRLGENRVRRWFETGVLAIKDWETPETPDQREQRLREELEGELTTDEPELTVQSERLREELEGELHERAQDEPDQPEGEDQGEELRERASESPSDDTPDSEEPKPSADTPEE